MIDDLPTLPRISNKNIVNQSKIITVLGYGVIVSLEEFNARFAGYFRPKKQQPYWEKIPNTNLDGLDVYFQSKHLTLQSYIFVSVRNAYISDGIKTSWIIFDNNALFNDEETENYYYDFFEKAFPNSDIGYVAFSYILD